MVEEAEEQVPPPRSRVRKWVLAALGGIALNLAANIVWVGILAAKPGSVKWLPPGKSLSSSLGKLHDVDAVWGHLANTVMLVVVGAIALAVLSGLAGDWIEKAAPSSEDETMLASVANATFLSSIAVVVLAIFSIPIMDLITMVYNTYHGLPVLTPGSQSWLK
jgi:hypothetical protein